MADKTSSNEKTQKDDKCQSFQDLENKMSNSLDGVQITYDMHGKYFRKVSFISKSHLWIDNDMTLANNKIRFELTNKMNDLKERIKSKKKQQQERNRINKRAVLNLICHKDQNLLVPPNKIK